MVHHATSITAEFSIWSSILSLLFKIIQRKSAFYALESTKNSFVDALFLITPFSNIFENNAWTEGANLRKTSLSLQGQWARILLRLFLVQRNRQLPTLTAKCWIEKKNPSMSVYLNSRAITAPFQEWLVLAAKGNAAIPDLSVFWYAAGPVRLQ